MAACEGLAALKVDGVDASLLRAAAAAVLRQAALPRRLPRE